MDDSERAQSALNDGKPEIIGNAADASGARIHSRVRRSYLQLQERQTREDAQLTKWLNEDDSDRPMKMLSALASPERAELDRWAKEQRDAGRNDWEFAGEWHEKRLAIFDRYDISVHPMINTPERLQWWIEKHTDDLVELKRRLGGLGYDSIAPITMNKAIDDLHKAHEYADEIWRSNPELPEVPPPQPNDLRLWRRSLLNWCVKTAPAKLPDPSNIDKLTVNAPTQSESSLKDQIKQAIVEVKQEAVDDPLKRLTAGQRDAWTAFHRADAAGCADTDRDAWDWIQENWDGEPFENYDAWYKALQRARRKLDRRKRNPRRGRKSESSIHHSQRDHRTTDRD